MQLSLQIVYISGMGKAQKDIQTIQHRNMWGEWTFTFEGNTLCGLRFSGSGESSIVPSSVKACAYATPDTDIPLKRSTTKAYNNVVKELNQYLAGKITEFTVPIAIHGTEFQVSVLEATRKIPYGKTWTYKQVAEAIGHPNAERAVGNTLHNNPLQVIIPCHRVVTSKGKIGGYALGTDLKRRLLCMEGAIQNELELE